MTKYSRNNPISATFAYILLGVLLFSCNCEPVLMTEQVGRQIFEENKYYLIYVYQQLNEKNLQNFNEHCENRTNCAILNTTVQEYQKLRKFIGKKGRQYFLILNVPFEKKYVLDVDNRQIISKNELREFEKKYEEEKLDAFEASQPLPKTNSKVCTQLVGKNFDEFLEERSVLKVIYTYTKNEGCETCMDVLKQFKDLAQKMHNDDVLRFGYVDVYHNDIPNISDLIVPHFYIYQGQAMVRQVTETEVEELPSIIKSQVHRIMRQLEGKTQDHSSSTERSQEDL